MKNDITDILFKYTTGEATLEETNEALKEAEAGFHLEPGKNEITPEEAAQTVTGETPEEATGYGLLDTGTGSMEKVKIVNGKLGDAINQVNPDGTTNKLADLLRQLEGQGVDVVLVVVGPVDDGIIDALRAASVGVERDEDVAPLRGRSAFVDAEVGVDARPRGDDLEAPGLELGLELEMQRPNHRAFVVGLHDGALVVFAADMPGVETNLLTSKP